MQAERFSYLYIEFVCKTVNERVCGLPTFLPNRFHAVCIVFLRAVCVCRVHLPLVEAPLNPVKLRCRPMR